MIVAFAALLGSAWAQQACIEPMSRIQLGAAVGDVTDALEVSELIDAREGLNRIVERLPCLDEVVDRKLLALFARYNALVYFYGQEEDLAEKWGLSSKMIMADLPWDEKMFPPDHPVRKMIEEATLPAPLPVAGKHLDPPRGGGVFLNGLFAARPEAPPGVELLVQVFDRTGRKVDAYWQEGPAFKETLLAAKESDASPPAWWNGESMALGPKLPYDPPRPPPARKFPVVPAATSGGLALIAGGTYFFAYQAKLSLDPERSPDPAEVAGIRTRANLLVLASGATFAGALGVGIGGVLVSADGLTIRF